MALLKYETTAIEKNCQLYQLYSSQLAIERVVLMILENYSYIRTETHAVCNSEYSININLVQSCAQTLDTRDKTKLTAIFNQAFQALTEIMVILIPNLWLCCVIAIVIYVHMYVRNYIHVRSLMKVSSEITLFMYICVYKSINMDTVIAYVCIR